MPVQLSYHLILPFQLSSAGVNKDERQFSEADIARSLLYIISNDIGQISCLYTMLHKGQQDLVRQLLPEAQASQPPHNLLRHRSLPEGSRVTEDRELLLGNLYGGLSGSVSSSLEQLENKATLASLPSYLELLEEEEEITSDIIYHLMYYMLSPE